MQTAHNSQNSAVSLSQQPSAEHFLRDLISPAESHSDGLPGALRRPKRSHDGEAEDEPPAKRDRLNDDLGDELEALHAMAVAAGNGFSKGLPSTAAEQTSQGLAGENLITDSPSCTSSSDGDAAAAAIAQFGCRGASDSEHGF